MVGLASHEQIHDCLYQHRPFDDVGESLLPLTLRHKCVNLQIRNFRIRIERDHRPPREAAARFGGCIMRGT
jgi:hypothetical protein